MNGNLVTVSLGSKEPFSASDPYWPDGLRHIRDIWGSPQILEKQNIYFHDYFSPKRSSRFVHFQSILLPIPRP